MQVKNRFVIQWRQASCKIDSFAQRKLYMSFLPTLFNITAHRATQLVYSSEFKQKTDLKLLVFIQVLCWLRVG